MKYVFLAIGAAVAFFVLLYAFLVYTTIRASRRQNEQIFMSLLPLLDKLENGEPVTKEEVSEPASKAHLRQMLYQILADFERLDLFPEEYLSAESQAITNMVRWLMHPKEMRDAPAQIEVLETVTRWVEGKAADFHVLKYRMADDHWAADDGWLLGVSGPFFPNDVPYSTTNAFSEFDKLGEKSPQELVDWHMEKIMR